MFDLSGMTALVTGASGGLGSAIAKALSDQGARLALSGSNADKLETFRSSLDGDHVALPANLSDGAAVDQLVPQALDALGGKLDILVNNAGIMAVPEARTADGFESQLGTNHLGHFALTGLLLPHVTDRVVTVASNAHRIGGLDLDDLNWERRSYDPWKAYGQSKLANLLFTLELQRRLDEAGSPVRAVAAHPGYAATHLQERTGNLLQHAAMRIGNVVLAQSDERGAWPTLFAATQDLPGGAYVGPDGPGGWRGRPALASRSAAARDASAARVLWERSEALTGTASGLAPAA